MPMTQEHIADRMGRAMRRMRQATPCDQKTLARRMGISRISLGRIERGQTQPRMNTMLTWCRVMKVTVDDVAGVAQLIWLVDHRIEGLLADNLEGGDQ